MHAYMYYCMYLKLLDPGCKRQIQMSSCLFICKKAFTDVYLFISAQINIELINSQFLEEILIINILDFAANKNMMDFH